MASKQEVKAMIIRLMVDNLSLEIDKNVITIQQYIGRLAQQGMNQEAIKNLLKQDAENGGVVFGSLKRSIQQQVLYAANAGNTDAKVMQFGEQESKAYQWIAVIDSNTCPDCAPRHNQILTLAEWQQMGLPGTGWSYCREFCRCSLIPADNLSKEDKRSLELPISKSELKDFKANRKDGMEKFLSQLNKL